MVNRFNPNNDPTLSSQTPSLEERRILPKEDLGVIFSGLLGSSAAPAKQSMLLRLSMISGTFICSSAKSVKIFSGKG